MMRERDIRQETFEEYKDSKQSKLVTFSALTTGVGMLAAFGFGQFSFFFGSAIGLVFIIVICRYIYVFRKIAGLMGAIQVGAKFDIFVDPNNPLNFYLANPDVSKYTVQELKQMPGVQDADSHILDKYL